MTTQHLPPVGVVGLVISTPWILPRHDGVGETTPFIDLGV